MKCPPSEDEAADDAETDPMNACPAPTASAPTGRKPGRPRKADTPKLVRRDERWLRRLEAGETVGQIGEDCRYSERTIRQGILDAKARRDDAAGTPADDPSALTADDRRHVSRIYGHSKDPDVQAWLRQQRESRSRGD